MSKLTEKVVASQLINHISSHGLDEILQLTQQYNHNLLNNFWDLTTQNNLMTTISTQALENLYINLQQHPNFRSTLIALATLVNSDKLVIVLTKSAPASILFHLLHEEERKIFAKIFLV